MILINKEQLLDAVMKKSYSQASIQLINDQPEVLAIPIEWIKEYNRVRGWEVTVTTLNAIDNMLNAWEKENDTQI